MGKPSIKLSAFKFPTPKILAFQVPTIAVPEAKVDNKPPEKIDIKNITASRIREKLDEKFKDNYLAKNFPGVTLPFNTTPMIAYRANRDALLEKVSAFQTYDVLVADKEKQLATNPNLKVRTEIRDAIFADPNASPSLKQRATWIPAGENENKKSLSGVDIGNGGLGGLFGGLAGTGVAAFWWLLVPSRADTAMSEALYYNCNASNAFIRNAGIKALERMNSIGGFRKFLSSAWVKGGVGRRWVAPIAIGTAALGGLATYISYKMSQSSFDGRNQEAKTNDDKLNARLQDDVNDDIDSIGNINSSPKPVPTPTPLPVSSGGGGGGFSSCFIAGTKVTMKDGSYKDIEKVKLGDEVLAYDEVKKITYSSPVVLLQNHIKDPQLLHHFKLSDGTEFTSNAPHAIYVENFNTYKAASEIYSRYKNGEKIYLKNQNGKPVSVDKITTEEKIEPVYNLHVDGVTDDDSVVKYGIGHNYYANGVLVHNAY